MAKSTTKHKVEVVPAPPEPGKWPTGDKPAVYAPEWRDYFREIILTRRKEILRELNYLRETSMETTTDQYSGDNSTYSYHMADQGTDAQEREKAFLFASREGKMLRLLDQALERVENGTYGFCQESNAPIEFKRLEAIPHARLCIAAKKKHEEENSPGE
jgi:DnaK suppressor protein